MYFLKGLSVALVIFTVTACTHVGKPFLSSTPDPLYYRALHNVVLSDVLPPPPAPHSIAEQQDIAAVANAQKQRSTAQVQKAQCDIIKSVFQFRSVLGLSVSSQDVPLTTAFFVHVTNDTDVVVRAAKAHYRRPRPSHISAHIAPAIPVPDDAAYPSGHTVFAYVTAALLAQIVPEKTRQLYDYADQYAQSRLIGGVHYPTDMMAGKMAAAAIVEALLQDPQVQKDLTQAARELRQHVHLTPLKQEECVQDKGDAPR